ncbi:SMC family ATPase [Pseudarthrobacter sp. J75]|uniref:SMC family ATPase n=1 Tax=unclassified Pseudarthrobacter TaxID=2647000 RepID=UPI002E80C488|nr:MULTISPECIES: SMC family ATPase [unclassified Pseudarthrobacter]MEE2521506.1 SMC family ATPase [Pseudarthrobacter sp. J47]MEE2528738.1 SMC family ATPase [Pseudarthrobacter sp. J75]
MRIHRLAMSAFGPFAGTEEVDFERLGAHGLFLLNGATGAGKTSVLDAICFALYGSVPGARQESRRLRSDHADAATEPSVTCEFTAQGRHFEVTRSPAWDKPSARGKNGFTTQQAKTLLRERVDGAWVEKSSRNDEAGAEITALLGMDREQFTRVVMLPQGDFAAFLRSKAGERSELLQKLFGTHRFEAVEKELGVQAQEARAAVERYADRTRMLMERARAEAAQLQDVPEAEQLRDDEGSQAADAVAVVDQFHVQAVQAAANAAAREAAAEAERARTASMAEDVTARMERHQRLAAARQRQAAAAAAAPELEAAAAALARHRMAEVLSGQLSALAAARTAHEQAAMSWSEAMEMLRMDIAQDPELAEMDSGSPDVEAGHERLKALQMHIEARLPDEQRLNGLRERQKDLAARKIRLLETTEALKGRSGALAGKLSGLAAEILPLEGPAADAALLAKEAAAARELVAVVRRHDAATADAAAAGDRHRAALDHHLACRKTWLDLREERLANAAAELAGGLAPGDPCPVCGSEEHPAPPPAARAALELAREEQDAQQVAEAAEAALDAVARDLAQARQQLAVLAGRGGDTPLADALGQADEATAAARAAEQAAARLEELRALRRDAEESLAGVADALSAADREQAETESELAEVNRQVADLDPALAELRGTHKGLAHRLRALRKSLSTLDAVHRSGVQAQTAAARLAEAEQQLDAALPDSGFSNAAEAAEALLPARGAEALQAKIRDAQNEEARLAELMESPGVVQALEEEAAGRTVDPAAVAEARALADDAAAAAREASLAAAVAARSVSTLEGIRAELETLLAESLGPQEKARILAGLAEAAGGRGENTYRMSLNSYVLAARLEQVASAASERLVAMSDGRYLLKYTDAKAARGAKSGLGLEVVDQWTGHRRDTSTLSGGESFMAALSLALGLADVVQQESGGVDIETLFVDEGFGSLDEQSLEQVMDALEGLRDGGRVVGLVSHVAEMKQRIGVQLQVVKGRTGSTLHISDTAAA